VGDYPLQTVPESGAEIERAIETAALMLGSDITRLLLGVICGLLGWCQSGQRRSGDIPVLGDEVLQVRTKIIFDADASVKRRVDVCPSGYRSQPKVRRH
jgi:hypothetical protein